jgi:class 3 adenylate cyclase
MDQRTNRTFICSVLFLDIVAYSKKPVEEQIAVKGRFNALLSDIIQDIAVNDRIILDTGDGAAIGFLGDPEDALFVAMELRESVMNEQPTSSPPLSIRMGINLGPVKLVKDINKQLNLIGDGINVGQRVMSFAQPGQLLVSRSYYEVISCLTQEYAKLFVYEGGHADKHIREHGIYAVGHFASDKTSLSGIRSRRNIPAEKDGTVKEVLSRSEDGQSTGTHVIGHGEATSIPSAVHRILRGKWFYAAASLTVIVILLGAFLLFRSGTPVRTDLATTTPTPAAAPAPSSSTKGSGDTSVTARSEVPTSSARVNFRVLPWGEIYINGKKEGVCPPLTTVKLKPGKYNIEVKNTSFPTYSQTVEVKSNGIIEIRHKFQ